MEALLDFELIERNSIINNFEARNITVILTIFRKTKMLENMRIFIPEKVLIYTCYHYGEEVKKRLRGRLSNSRR